MNLLGSKILPWQSFDTQDFWNGIEVVPLFAAEESLPTDK
jgi:hypothetical protein